MGELITAYKELESKIIQSSVKSNLGSLVLDKAFTEYYIISPNLDYSILSYRINIHYIGKQTVESYNYIYQTDFVIYPYANFTTIFEGANLLIARETLQICFGNFLPYLQKEVHLESGEKEGLLLLLYNNVSLKNFASNKDYSDIELKEG